LDGSVLIRPAVPADVEPLVALIQSAYRGDPSRAGWTTEADLLQGQRTDRDAVGALVAVGAMTVGAEADGALLGCCQLERRGTVAYFGTFAVRPARQGAGTGSALLADAERRARAWGCTTMEMTVLAQRTDLIPYYERRGYVRTGEDRPFPYGDERYGRPQREDLVFTVLAKEL
jgi:GNAT superfamily N-acetyltransferase